jgi:hypothetical protein
MAATVWHYSSWVRACARVGGWGGRFDALCISCDPRFMLQCVHPHPIEPSAHADPAWASGVGLVKQPQSACSCVCARCGGMQLPQRSTVWRSTAQTTLPPNNTHTLTWSSSRAASSPYFHLKSRLCRARARTSGAGWPAVVQAVRQGASITCTVQQGSQLLGVHVTSTQDARTQLLCDIIHDVCLLKNT